MRWKLIRRTLLILFLGLIALIASFYRADIPVTELRAKYANPASRFTAIAELDVHFRDEGPRTDTVPLVLIHGTGASLLTWDGWVNELGAERRIIRLDLPAYGLTGPNATGNYSPAYYDSFLHQFLTAIGVRRCDLAGNSLGGAIAWRVALEHPEKVRRLVLVDAAGYPLESRSVPLAFRMARMPVLKDWLTYITPRSLIERSIKSVYADDRRVTDALVDQYYDMALRAGNRKAFVNRFAAKPDSAWTRMATIRTPTLVLWGAQDGLIPVDYAHRFHRDLPNDTLVIMPDAGHVPMEELPVESARIVRAFLR